MLVKVKGVSGKTVEISSLEPTSRVVNLKEKMEEIQGVPVAQQCLVFAGQKLEDSKTLEEYKIGAGSTVHLVLALRAGQ